MKRIALPLLAIAVSLVWAHGAKAATRPRYGGSLRLALLSAPTSLDPNDTAQAASVSLQSMSRLLFDTLVVLDEHGQPQPSLASSWQPEPGNQRWLFTLRRGVTFSDGSPLNSDSVAASLRNANPQWRIFSGADSVTIECAAPNPLLPAALAQTRYGIAKRDRQPRGSGPFNIQDWVPGKKLTLTARDDYWNGRAFPDTLEIEMGKPVRDQMIAFDVGKLDLVEVTPETAFTANDRRIERSAPIQWLGLVFAQNPSSPEESGLREALGLSIDRSTINDVLLRGSGEITGSLLPGWMSGYSFLLPAQRDLDRARQLRSQVNQTAPWTLSFDSGDPLLRLIADRIILNAKDAGIALQLSSSASTDIRLLRLLPSSSQAHIALSDLLIRLGLPAPVFENTSYTALYNAEKSALDSQRVIPLFHLRFRLALANTLRGWQDSRSGAWPIENIWISAGSP